MFCDGILLAITIKRVNSPRKGRAGPGLAGLTLLGMQPDKLKHFAAGFAIAMLFGAVHHSLGLAMAAIVGKAKEDYDKARPDRHTSDGWDAFATVCGAVPAQVLHAVAPRLWGLF